MRAGTGSWPLAFGFELGAVEPAESFIAGAIEPIPVAGGLSLERDVAADGAWFVREIARPDALTCIATPLPLDLFPALEVRVE